jgi:hypothetical protein
VIEKLVERVVDMMISERMYNFFVCFAWDNLVY